MDDILASIRRILNEDEPAGGAGAPARPAADAPPPAEPIELTESMLVTPPQPAPPARAAEREPEGEPMEPPRTEPTRIEPPRMEPQRAEPPQVDDPPPPAADTLVAPAVAAATTAALGHLLRTVAAERQSPVLRGGGPSIEDVVREELRPLLKAWLDQHLPPLAERLVRARSSGWSGRACRAPHRRCGCDPRFQRGAGRGVSPPP
jgi:cell pole-organizing protein PopZ